MKLIMASICLLTLVGCGPTGGREGQEGSCELVAGNVECSMEISEIEFVGSKQEVGKAIKVYKFSSTQSIEFSSSGDKEWKRFRLNFTPKPGDKMKIKLSNGKEVDVLLS